jgi:hypothetical protein
MSATPPVIPAELLAQMRSRAQMAENLQVHISQMLFDHPHHVVLDVLLGSYVSLVTKCPDCTEQAVRMLPALASQLQNIAAAHGQPKALTTPPAGTPLH